ncbi:DNA-directed RNA polymerases I and III subunit RPAC2-like [Ambystoma mexicanum]|uniref:DNA-directed RNA polymerases I and III subunit RPAC2-like n=1 Tax=Ambystoma mexicanum TaxID=8296 RepID=UPI0037E80C2E
MVLRFNRVLTSQACDRLHCIAGLTDSQCHTEDCSMAETKPVLEMVQANGTDDSCVTFVLHEEDHTLGNSLRYMIMKNPEVEFCGYCITHPSESKINFRIQTRGGIPAVEPFRRGLNELIDVCQHVLNTFQVSMKEYKEQNPDETN